MKTTGDDGSDIKGCLLALSETGLAQIELLDKAADAASNAHRSFAGLSFNVDGFNVPGGDLAGVEVHWITDSDWEDRFNVGVDDEYTFISRQQFARLKKTNVTDWHVGSTQLVFNQ